MNIEIKFRAWDNFNSQYWYSQKYENLGDFFTKMQHLINGGNDLVFEQYTGLKDKNGKEIYEGDILTYQNGSGPKKVVEYNNEQGYYRCKFHKGGGFIDTLDYYMKRKCEIIGNIYESSESTQSSE